MTSVFDDMAAARARAAVLREMPFAWRVNPAALAALHNEGAFDGGAERPIEELALFGLHIIVDREDQSEEPVFRLIAEKPKRA